MRWILAPVAWRLPSHPPMDRRIATLEEMAASRRFAHLAEGYGIVDISDRVLTKWPDGR